MRKLRNSTNRIKDGKIFLEILHKENLSNQGIGAVDCLTEILEILSDNLKIYEEHDKEAEQLFLNQFKFNKGKNE